MRSSKSRSRAKNRGANRSPANNLNRVFDSSGPEGKVRGTPQQIIDKYTQLARDAFLAGDRVAGENFQQHAEHYTRLLAEAQRDAEAKRQQTEHQQRDRQPQQQQQQQQQQPQQQQPQQKRQRNRDAGQDQTHETQPAPLPADVVDLGEPADVSDSGLVETPEEQPRKKPARARKPRAPRAPRTGGQADGDQPADSPDISQDPSEAAAG